MDTNVLALKNLYVAFGGDLATVAGINTNTGMINALAALVSGGASTLPTVTAEDNGKVLTVVDGAWEAAAPAAAVETASGS